MESIIEMGKISARGQIAIPLEIRTQLGLDDGSKVLFYTENDALIMKKITTKTFAEITKPLKIAIKKAGIKEKDVTDIIRQVRKQP
ncbi:MAG: AbrB/MazE/SpoVT family DNA-binding domain-containing protein [Nanoarchaeota archaeon]